jgi:hypothetical protein
MWLKLLENWSLEEKRTGLTIPFVVGFLNYNEKKIGSVNELFELILNSNEETHVYLNYCDEFLGEYVLSIKENEKIHLVETRNKTSIVFTQSCDVLGKTYIEILEKLNSKYNQYIENSEYSKNGNDWGNFNKKEIEFVEKHL